MRAQIGFFIEVSFCPLNLHIGMVPRLVRTSLKSKWLRYLSSVVEFIACFFSQWLHPSLLRNICLLLIAEN